MRTIATWLFVALWWTPVGQALAQEPTQQLVDSFQDAASWQLLTPAQGQGTLTSGQSADGNGGLCLNYAAPATAAAVGLRKPLPLTYSDTSMLVLRYHGQSAPVDLEIIVSDPAVGLAWSVNQTQVPVSGNAQELVIPKQQWLLADDADRNAQLRQTSQIKILVRQPHGGQGTVCFDQLAVRSQPAADLSPYRAKVTTDTAPALQQRIVDDNTATFWLSSAVKQQTITLDLGSVRDFGGVVMDWVPQLQADQYGVRGSPDGRLWQLLRTVKDGRAPMQWLALPNASARYLRFDLANGPNWRYGLKEIRVLPSSVSTTRDRFIAAYASSQPSGNLPPIGTHEPRYWTALGSPASPTTAVLNEDGAVQIGQAGWTVEPFVTIDDQQLVSWSKVKINQRLVDEHLPMPQVIWQTDQLQLTISGFVLDPMAQTRFAVRYQLQNLSSKKHKYALVLAIRPFQFQANDGNRVGSIDQLSVTPSSVTVNGITQMTTIEKPTEVFATSFDAGLEVTHLLDSVLPRSLSVNDETHLASGALLYRWQLSSNQVEQASVVMDAGSGQGAVTDIGHAQEETTRFWQDALQPLHVAMPAPAQPIAETMQTAFAQLLMAYYPDPHALATSAMDIHEGLQASEALLRLGKNRLVADRLRWYASQQFADGMIPCSIASSVRNPQFSSVCVGQFIHAVVMYYRYTHEQSFAQTMWPVIQKGIDYLTTVRQHQAAQSDQLTNRAMLGLLPAANEDGMASAPPEHRYLDNFWAVQSYFNAALFAKALGKDQEYEQLTSAAQSLADDVQKSLQISQRQQRISYVPKSVEHADLDFATLSCAARLDTTLLPILSELVSHGLPHSWDMLAHHHDQASAMNNALDAQWSMVRAFVLSKWANPASDLAMLLLRDRQPQAWNQWPTERSDQPRTSRLVGPFPALSVSAESLNASLDLVAAERPFDHSVLLAAGIPISWLGEEQSVTVRDLLTPYGQLNYHLSRHESQLQLSIDTSSGLPPGGFVYAWPLSDAPGAVTVNGQPGQWDTNRELHVTSVPALIEMTIPQSSANPH